MDQLLNYLLTQILIHGYPIIFGSIFLAYIGLPVPLNVLILAAGAFSVDGTLNVYVLLPLVSGSAFCGDIIQYYVGKRLGLVVINSYTSKIGISSVRLEYVKAFFNRWGGSSVFLTRWLLTPFGIPVNLIAGVNQYSFKSFLFWSAIGEIIWAGMYIYLGHLFGSSWVSILDYINDAPTFVAFIFMGLLSLFIGFKLWQKNTKHVG